MIKAVIFDFFGVVGLSTFEMIATKYNFSTDQKAKAWELHRVWDAGFIGRQAFMRDYADIVGISVKELTTSLANAEAGMGYNQSVLDLASSLRGQYKVGLLTNVNEDYYKYIQPITEQFDVVVASYQVKMAKPSVAIYELMAERLGFDVSECVMIDDIESNCEGARNAGMQAVCFTNTEKLKLELTKYLIQ